jgi:hypothetical protein
MTIEMMRAVKAATDAIKGAKKTTEFKLISIDVHYTSKCVIIQNHEKEGIFRLCVSNIG